MQVKEITDPTQTFYQNAEEWKRHIGLEDYVKRELKLNTMLHCRYWGCFVEGEMVASCRACIRTAIAQGNKGVEACIGNVFTLKKDRGHGYASYLLETVTKVLAQECILVTLWSDVGNFYAKFGYKMIPGSKKIVVPVSHQDWPLHVEEVSRANVADIVRRQESALKQKIGKNQVVVLPDIVMYNYWIEEALETAKVTDQTLPDIWGAKVNNSWCLWYYDLGRSKALVLLAIDGPDVEQVFAAAHHVASILGLARIETYLESIITGDLRRVGGEIEIRSSSLPAYISDYEWVYPGRYAWF